MAWLAPTADVGVNQQAQRRQPPNLFYTSFAQRISPPVSHDSR